MNTPITTCPMCNAAVTGKRCQHCGELLLHLHRCGVCDETVTRDYYFLPAFDADCPDCGGRGVVPLDLHEQGHGATEKQCRCRFQLKLCSRCEYALSSLVPTQHDLPRFLATLFAAGFALAVVFLAVEPTANGLGLAAALTGLALVTVPMYLAITTRRPAWRPDRKLTAAERQTLQQLVTELRENHVRLVEHARDPHQVLPLINTTLQQKQPRPG